MPGNGDKHQSRQAGVCWHDNDYSTIARRARSEKGVICWGGETSTRINANEGGDNIIDDTGLDTSLTAENCHVTIMYTFTNTGKVTFMMYRGANYSKQLISFMGRIARDAGRKVFLLLDNLKYFRSEQIRKWLEKHKDKIEVYVPADLFGKDLK